MSGIIGGYCRVLVWNLISRPINNWRARRALLPAWIAEGRDPKKFPSGCAWIRYRDLEEAKKLYGRLTMKIKGPLTATWKAGGYDRPKEALLIGGLYVGGIECSTNRYHGPTPWGGWFISSENGRTQTGWFMNAAEARQSVEDALAKALANG